MSGEMKYLVCSFTRSCQHLVKDTFGWETEDLEQYMLTTLWKGLATYDKDKKIKKVTYLSVIFRNSMSNLIKSCNRDKRKYTRLSCSPDHESIFESEGDIGGEEWMSYQTSFKTVVDALSDKERKIMAYHLAYGMGISEICKKTKLKKTEVVSIIKDIKEKIDEMREFLCQTNL